MSRRVLVTGGAGFVGAHLCRRLLADGRRVLCLDDLSTGRRANLADCLATPRFELVEGDVTAPMRFAVDEVYHLACPASPVHYQRDPLRTLDICTRGTVHALEAAHDAGARILCVSTSEVYGDPAVHPQPESYRGQVGTLGPRSCYAEGKRCGEAIAAAFARRHRTTVRLARIFNTYGPGMQEDDGRVVSSFISDCLRGRPLRVHGDGRQTRSFCYVDDVVEGLVRFMAAPVPAGEATPLNLGQPEEVPIVELARRVRELTGATSAVVHGERADDDPARRCPDITRARALLGWSPSVSLDDGLRRTIAELRTRLAAEAAA